MISVTICYALPRRQVSHVLDVTEGATLQAAIEQSGILAEFPEIQLTAMKTGIYSELKPLDTILNDGDRVEIYRPVPDQRRTLRKQTGK
ncbi:MAG: RnfH family protein [Proteobacteria bacterium]|nr:RnfH family protein [Pseudomonadota bacterium]